MKKNNSSTIALLGIILGAIALIATITSALVILQKKKEDEELERYLEDSIQ